MDEKIAETLAINASLAKAWTHHRADVMEALVSLAAQQANLPRTRDAAIEPVPPYSLKR